MAVTQRPANLQREAYLLILCDRITHALTLVLSADQSYDLGSYWTVEDDALPYLARALGNKWQLATDAITSAYNFGAAIIHVDIDHSAPLDLEDPAEQQRELLRKMFGPVDYEDVIGKYDEGNVFIDPIAPR